MMNANRPLERKRISSTRILIMSGAGVIAFLACAATWRYYYPADRSPMEDLSDLEARGFATTIEGLEDLYPYLPNEENGARAYAAAIKWFVEPVSMLDKYFRPWAPLPQTTMAALAAHAAANTESFDLLADAMAFEGAGIPSFFRWDTRRCCPIS